MRSAQYFLATLLLLAAFSAAAQTQATPPAPNQRKVLTEDDLAQPSVAATQAPSEPSSMPDAGVNKTGSNEGDTPAKSTASTDAGEVDPAPLEAEQKDLETKISGIQARLHTELPDSERGSLNDTLQTDMERLEQVKAILERISGRKGAEAEPKQDEAPKESSEEPPK